MNRRFRWMLALLAALAVAVAGCAPAEEPPATDTPEDPAEDPAGDLGLQQEGTIVVGSDIDFEPFEFVDDDGNPAGFDIDLMEEIASRLDLEVEWVNTGFDGIFTALAGGQFDAIVSAITITDERRETIDFTDPYFAANQAIAVMAGSDVTGPDDLAGLDVAVQAGTTGEEYASENFTESTIVDFPTSPAAFSALEAGQVDAVFIDLPVVAQQVADRPDVEMAAEVETDELYGIGIPQENTGLRDAINGVLQEIVDDGTYEEIYSRWFEGDPPEQFRSA